MALSTPLAKRVSFVFVGNGMGNAVSARLKKGDNIYKLRMLSLPRPEGMP
jgi:hypothetical protein